jgi:hypothetical protein
MLRDNGSTVQSISCRAQTVKGNADPPEAELEPEARERRSGYDQMREAGDEDRNRIGEEPMQSTREEVSI